MVETKTGWLVQATVFVGCITALRLLALALSKADIFVDEAQYWLWGQYLDFGYYSKPPLIAWVIRASTELGCSDSAFWIRVSAPILHGATALILGAFAARVFGKRPALWVTVSYLTLPIVSLGSLVISTDTVMAPFFAAGLLFYWRLLAAGRPLDAILAGGMIGLAFMSKYAGVYFFMGAGLAAIFVSSCRPSLKNWLLLLMAFLLVTSPNLIWNLGHDLTTVDHTIDNVGWLRSGGKSFELHPKAFLEFFATQFVVMGPVLLIALLRSCWRPDRKILPLLLFSVPVIALVCTQALLSKAYGNWAFAAYLAGTVAAVVWLSGRRMRWLWISLSINSALAIAVPTLAVMGDKILVDGKPILLRNMGRDELSEEILSLAKQIGPSAIVAANRDVLADLFLTGRNNSLPIRAVPDSGRPRNYYEQEFPLEERTEGTVLFVGERLPAECQSNDTQPLVHFETAGSAYEAMKLKGYVMTADCFFGSKSF